MEYTLEELNEMVEEANEDNSSLWLDGLTSIPEGFNPTVGGSLWLNRLTSIPKGFNPTVGGSLGLNGLTSKRRRLNDGDYKPGEYIYADGILTHVKRKKKIDGYTYYVGKIPSRNVIYDGVNFAHCKSFRDGVANLEFKKAADRGADQYRNLRLDSVLTVEEAKNMYRIITGACKAGTEQFVQSLGELKEKYTVGEIIELTRGAYRGAVFEKFFEK